MTRRSGLVAPALLSCACSEKSRSKPDGMRWIPGGKCRMGSENTNEGPVHKVTVSAIFNETNNLAKKYPSMVAELKKTLFDAEARKYNLVTQGRPPAYGDRNVFTYYPDTSPFNFAGKIRKVVIELLP